MGPSKDGSDPLTTITSEADLYAPVLKLLSKRGARAFRNHVGLSAHGNTSSGQNRYVRSGLCPGSSDIIGWTRDGRFLAIELKRPGWKPTKKWLAGMQPKFLKAVADAGGVSGVITSVDEAEALLSAHGYA